MSEENRGCGCNGGCAHDCGDCHEPGGCPSCRRKGLPVPYETVESLSIPNIKEQINNYKKTQFYLCTSKGCQVAYYTDNNEKVYCHELTVPIWFKPNKEEYLVCYCRRISLDDVIEAVSHLKGEISQEMVVNYLNKSEVLTDCLHNNPTGRCCDPLFENAIKYAEKCKQVGVG